MLLLLLASPTTPYHTATHTASRADGFALHGHWSCCCSSSLWAAAAVSRPVVCWLSQYCVVVVEVEEQTLDMNWEAPIFSCPSLSSSELSEWVSDSEWWIDVWCLTSWAPPPPPPSFVANLISNRGLLVWLLCLHGGSLLFFFSASPSSSFSFIHSDFIRVVVVGRR